MSDASVASTPYMTVQRTLRSIGGDDTAPRAWTNLGGIAGRSEEIELFRFGGPDRQADRVRVDRLEELRGHVLLVDPERAGAHPQAREDAGLGVAEHLLDRPELLAVGGDYVVTRLEHEPRDRVGHDQTAFPPTYQTGPWVETGSVSERTRRMRSWPVIGSPSTRSRHLRTTAGEAP